MIYVWDNGEEYSDHQVLFVETDYSAGAVAATLRLRNPEGFIVFAAEKVEWFRADASPLRMSAYHLLGVLREGGIPDEIPVAVIRQAAEEYLKESGVPGYGRGWTPNDLTAMQSDKDVLRALLAKIGPE